jgi:hypothetical protein
MKTYQIRLFPSKDQINQLQELSNIRKNILHRWFENHFASMNEPLDLSNVVKKFNLFDETIIK